MLIALLTALWALEFLGYLLQRNLLITSFFVIVIAAVLRLRTSAHSVLSRYSVVVFALPFVTLIGYLFSDEYQWWDTPLAIRYMSDDLVMRHLVTVGLVGLLGLLLGMSRGRSTGGKAPALNSSRVLSSAPFVLLLVTSLALSWFSAPSSNLWSVAYGSSGTAGLASNFNVQSAYLISYIVLILLYVDSERELAPHRRRAKLIGVLVAVGIAVGYFQILRGDRESFGLLAAVAGLYLTSDRRAIFRRWTRRAFVRRLIILTGPAVVVVLVFILIGQVRTMPGTVSTVPVASTIREGLAAPPGTAVLLTNLHISAEHQFDPQDLLWGKTYLDYVISLPPRPVAEAFGFQRPIDLNQGPAWWAEGLSSGGVHVVNVPFRNFGLTGVAVVMALVGAAISAIDQRARSGLWGRLLFGSTIAVLPIWFWYGDMAGIRALMIAGGVRVAYRFLARSGVRTGATAPPAPVATRLA